MALAGVPERKQVSRNGIDEKLSELKLCEAELCEKELCEV